MKFPKWQLHRGFWREGIRENTLKAFEQAKAMGCLMVELDAQLSRDGHLHVFHDFSLKKFFHIKKNLRKVRSEDLTGLSIPRLEEILLSENIPEYLNIEIKTQSWLCYEEVRALLKISSSLSKKKVMVSSFHPMVLFWMKKLLPKIPRALIVGDEKRLKSRRFDWEIKLSEPHFINCSYKLVDDEESREFLLYYEKPLMIWTVNDHEKAQVYLARGAKSIISDLPPKADF